MAATAPYQVLARKYRPRAFDEVVGQPSVVTTLKNAISTGRLHHAYLFSGTRGVGKTTLARLFARALNCVKGPTTDPCSTCDPCTEIAAGSSMDVIEIDGASNRKVEDVDPLREAARYAPARDRHKIFLIDEVHMLSETAFNALLKILEEPPPRIVFLFATTEPEQVPETIMSRCLHLACRRVSTQEIAAAMERTGKAEKIKGTREAYDLIAGLASGSMRDGLSLLDQVIAYAGREVTGESVRTALGLIDRRLTREFIETIGRADSAGVLAVIERLSQAGADLTNFSREALARVRDMMVAKAAGAEAAASLGLSADQAAECGELAEVFSQDGLLRLMTAMLDLADRIRREENPRFLLEASALKMIRLADLTPIEDLIRGIGAAGGATGGGGPAPGRETEKGSTGSAAVSSTATASGARGGLRFTSVTPVGRAPESAAEPPRGKSAGGPGPGEPSPEVSRILDRVAERKLSLATFLQQAPWVHLKDGTLVVSVRERQGFLKTALESSDNLSVLREAAGAVMGRPIEVRVEPEAPADADLSAVAGREGQGSAPLLKRERLIGEALAEPLVRSVMDLFKGQIVDIREDS
jgi:DNA polymerase-3 subunit gamma/tau